MEKKKMKIWKKLLIALGVIIALLAIVFIGYDEKIKNPNSKISKRCCDFKLLENKCREYI